MKEKKDCPNFESWKECYHTCIFYPVCRRYYRVMEEFEEKKDCNECELYGECDHQGAYKKDGKWCYEDWGDNDDLD